jgi:hypothetical protein
VKISEDTPTDGEHHRAVSPNQSLECRFVFLDQEGFKKLTVRQPADVLQG